MRFIGNKDTLLPEIHNLLYEKNLLDLDKEYISKITVEKEIADIFINEQVLEYLNIRNLDL